jgi:polyphosphate kinase
MSIVGRYLEHSRIFYFHRGGHPEVLIGSADLMRRNLDRRIEVLVPIEHGLAHRLLSEVLEPCLRDNVQSWDLDSEGQYNRREPRPDEAFSAQNYLMEHPFGGAWSSGPKRRRRKA